MRKRVLILLVLFELRLLPGQINGFLYPLGGWVRVTGNANKIIRNVSNCEVEVGAFSAKIEGYCRFSQGSEVRLIGRLERGLTEMFWGRLRLSDAKIDVFENIEFGGLSDSHDRAFFDRLREKIRVIFTRLLPGEEASLVAGIVMGDKEAIGESFYQRMIQSGTIHIVVASGYNVMLLSGFVMSILFWLLRRPKATIVAVALVWFYAALSGGDPSIVRASVMAMILLIGEALGRRSVSWWSLVIAGWLMIMIEPRVLTSVSFQLSMAASVGLMVVYPQIMRWSVIQNSRLIVLLDRVGLMTTVSTMVTTAPFIAGHFGRVNLVGLISNIFVLPFVPPVMILGATTIVFKGLTAPFLYAFAHWIVVVIGWFG